MEEHSVSHFEDPKLVSSVRLQYESVGVKKVEEEDKIYVFAGKDSKTSFSSGANVKNK